MNQLLNHMFLVANRAQMNIGYPHFGIISSVDPVDYTVKVVLQPEEIETGFIPYLTPSSGFVAPPSPGDQCMVLFERGNNNVPFAIGIAYWNEDRPPYISTPGDIQPGEFVFKNKISGNYLRIANDGQIFINDCTAINTSSETLTVTTTQDIKLISDGGNVDVSATGGQITLEAPQINLKGDVTIDGNLTANNGDISMTSGVISTNADIVTSADVQASGISLKTHIHPVPQGGDTGQPI